jgi:hypothetical protein
VASNRVRWPPCERSNEPSHSIKGEEFVDRLDDSFSVRTLFYEAS